MESIYSYSLCIALPLMLFFGFSLLFSPTPNKAIYNNYVRSRRIMGLAILLLAANYSVHFFFEIRFRSADAAITMNLSTYFLCYWLFSSALTTLLDRFYITKRRLRIHIALWIIFSILSGVVLLVLPKGPLQETALFVMAAWLVFYGLFLARRLILAYRRAVRIFNDTHSDDIGAYIKWMSVFTYWALIFGVGCGLLTFLPDDYVFIWILSSIPFYIYLYLCYQNYMLFYEQVENAMESEITSERDILCDMSNEDHVDDEPHVNDTTVSRTEIELKIKSWIEADGYVRSGLTIKELAEILHTNRTYISSYIKSTYNMTFRDWITDLRINYAKRILVGHPELTIADISERSGFQSASHFIRLFKETTDCSPAKWRKTEIK